MSDNPTRTHVAANDNPTTKEEAQKIRYGAWAGQPKGFPYDPDRCAYDVWHGMLSCQCARRNGHGPDDLYCKQHAKRIPS